jgi:hypothetical protein
MAYPDYTPAPPPQRRLSTRAVVLIVAGSALVLLLVLGLIGAGVAAFLSMRLSPSQPVLVGDAGPATAIDPVECPELCFDLDDIGSTILGISGPTRLGLTEAVSPWGEIPGTTAGELYRHAADGWERYEGESASCFFTPFNSPVGASIEVDESESPDPVEFVGVYEDPRQLSLLDQSVRVFPTSEAAQSHLTTIAANIDDCRNVEIGPASERYRARVDPASAFVLPDQVAAAGWIRTGTPGLRWRAYVADLQYANLVVRLRLLTDGSVREGDFRTLVENYAGTLAVLTPIPSSDTEDRPPASPDAHSPLDCASMCLDRVWAGLTAPSSAEYDALGLTVAGAFVPASSAQDQLATARADWVARDGAPDECFWSYPLVPIAPGSSVEVDADARRITQAVERADPARTSAVNQADREFLSSALAVEHMRAQFGALAECGSSVTVDVGGGPEIGALALSGFSTPDDVAAFGWSIELQSRSVYVVDIQRGHLVTRVSLVTTGSVSEERFQSLVESIAHRVARMDVVPSLR